jgi:hypothetical protein
MCHIPSCCCGWHWFLYQEKQGVMMKNSILASVMCSLFLPLAFAQTVSEGVVSAQTTSAEKEDNVNIPAPLPKSLRGRWSNTGSGHSDLVEVEVLEMNTPPNGKAQVTFWPYCRKSETPIVFERKLKVWRFTAANCSGNSDQIHMRVRPIEGQQRMEGWYHREGEGRTVYLEWKE